jgi:hypothetical protein
MQKRVMQVYLLPEDYLKVRKAAKKAGFSISEYARRKILDL